MSSQPAEKDIDMDNAYDLNDNPNLNEEAKLIIQKRTMSMSMSGPLPHPEILRQYEEILPGCAERIISMVERQSNHRHQMESKIVSGGSRDSLLGVIFGFIIGMTTVIVGFLLGKEGKNIPAAIIGTGGIIGLVSVFIYGTKSNRIERIHEDESTKHDIDNN